MTNPDSANATNSVIKTVQKSKSNSQTRSIRVKQKTSEKIEDLLNQANKNRIEKKIKADDIISVSLELITPSHLKQICDKVLTNKDRLEILFRKISKEKKGLTRDEFIGLLMDGKLIH